MRQRHAPTAPAAEVLNELRGNLLNLHRILLDSERSLYERDVAKIEGPGHFLGLLMNDPWFAYLRELSGLVVHIDEAIDGAEQPLTLVDAIALVRRAEELLRPAENGTGFGARYYEAMQRDPGVVLAHAATAKALAGLRAR
jgi:hypothetical protein